jgi:glutathione S-transferase
MYRLYGIPTQNTLKVAYVLDALGADYEFKSVDLFKGEHKRPEFLKINPLGKVPALQHDEFNLFESGAICRYVASVAESSLYPSDVKARAQVDAWLDFFATSLGRWLSVLFFEKVLKTLMPHRPEANEVKCQEATTFLDPLFASLEAHLEGSSNLTGEAVTIADLAALAYVEQTSAVGFNLSGYPRTLVWLERLSQLESVKLTKTKIKF